MPLRAKAPFAPLGGSPVVLLNISYISAPRPQMSQPSPQPQHILRAVSRTSLPPTRPARYSVCARRSCTAPATGWSRKPRRAWPAGRPAVNSARGGGTVGTVHTLCILCHGRDLAQLSLNYRESKKSVIFVYSL